MTPEERAVFASAIAKWGRDAQVLMLMEEMAELQVELAHLLRGRASWRDVAAEVADVRICLDEIEVALGGDVFAEVVAEVRKQKVARIGRRVAGEPGHFGEGRA